MSHTITARTEFAAAINQICAERGIEPVVVLDTIKAAILAAYRKDFGLEEETPYVVELDPDTGAARIIRGDTKEDVTPPGFGRIAAQTAKQVILQRIREAEKEAIIADYTGRLGTITNGMVLRFEGPNVIVDIGRGQGVMPPEEQMRGEYYKLNQRITVYIKEIGETPRGKAIIVSRGAPELVAELFRREVPEVASGAVEIKAIAREGGTRTKIAVDSKQEGVDPVGSCVGQKGVRVQAVIGELNNEKIDIIQYNPKVDKFMAAALAPAEGLQITVDEKKKKAVVVVPDDQLSLAIGRGGQNVRLAGKLIGDYTIEINGQSGKKGEVEEGEIEIDTLGLSKRTRNALVAAGLVTITEVKQADLTQVKGVGPAAQKEIAGKLKAK